MRVLFFLEPVIFQGNPAFLAYHFFWADCLRKAALADDGHFALAGNPDVCQQWRDSRSAAGADLRCFPIDPFRTLAAFGGSRRDYCRAIYGPGDTPNDLVDQLGEIRRAFAPDLVVMTSQNGLARFAFSGLPVLSIEQAPLPRFHHPVRTAFDPCGHQVGALLETHAERIKALPLSDADVGALQRLISEIASRGLAVDPRCTEGCAAIEAIRLDGPVALLVTQPPDWVTYDGAFASIELEGLVYAWAEDLPPGWIGVPTYHPGYQLNPAMEAALARSSTRLRFLPRHLSTGLTEALLSSADGMVTVSSTSAITSLLLGRRTAVVGRSPFNAWAVGAACDLDEAVPLSPREAASTLAFLTNRYSYVHEALMKDPAPLVALMRVMVTRQVPAEWFLDLADWTLERARALFNLG